MHSELRRRFFDIELQRAELQSLVLQQHRLVSGAMDQDWTQGSGAWSICQIVEHLVLSDETLGQAIEPNRMPVEAALFRLLPRPLRFALVVRALKQDATLPLPSPSVDPKGDVPLGEMLARWDAARRKMASTLETLHPNGRWYFHPVLGPLTAVQMLDLGHAHAAYHGRQIKALQDAFLSYSYSIS